MGVIAIDIFFKNAVNFFKTEVIDTLAQIGIIDVIDILLLTVLLFCAYRFIRNRRAGKLALGMLLIIVILLVSSAANMRAINFILQNFYQVGIIAIIIVFQPELRAALEKVGNTSIITGIKNITSGEQKQYLAMLDGAVNDICSAVFSMSKTKTGALIVIERATKLGEYIGTGTVINAQMSSDVIENIFFKNAPLHDGAIVVRDLRVYAAGCFLRITERDDVDGSLGTRHRAAIGISEVSDALAIVVSEETGKVSLAYDGNIKRGYNPQSLKQELIKILTPSGSLYKSKNSKEDKKA